MDYGLRYKSQNYKASRTKCRKNLSELEIRHFLYGTAKALTIKEKR